MEPGLGDAHAPDVDRHDPGHVGDTPFPVRCAGADDELGRPAADVDDEVGSGGVETGSGAEERQATLVLPGEEFDGGAEDLGRRAEEVVAVGGVAGGAGGGGPDARDAGGVHYVAVLAEDGQRPLDGVGVEPPGGVHALPEPGDVHVPLDGGERRGRAAAVAVGDEEPGRVGPHVDGGEAAHSCFSTHRPTGSSPPARCQA